MMTYALSLDTSYRDQSWACINNFTIFQRVKRHRFDFVRQMRHFRYSINTVLCHANSVYMHSQLLNLLTFFSLYEYQALVLKITTM